MEDKQATITLLLLGQAGVLRHTDRTQRWTLQVIECWHIRANSRCVHQALHGKEQVRALKLIGHTSSVHAGCKPVPKVEVAETISVAASPDGTQIVEEFAKKSLESKDFGYKTFEHLVELVRVHLKASSSKSRPLMSHEKLSTYLVFGAWVHGGCYGKTKRTQEHPWLCKYVNEFVSRSSPKGFTWTYSTLAAKLDSTLTSTTKKSRTTSSSPSETAQGGGALDRGCQQVGYASDIRG